MKEHCNGDEIYHYTGNGNPHDPECLICLDIDGDDPAKTFDCAETLRRKVFPGLYHEPSTYELGRHGYLILFKAGKSAEDIREALDDLETYLQQFAPEGVKIEVKGRPPEVLFFDGVAQAIKYGSFAKVPRGLFDRYDELANTTRVTVDELFALDDTTQYYSTIYADGSYDFRVGRNDQCPCCGGKKYKNCCLHENTAEAPHHENPEDIDSLLTVFEYYDEEVPENTVTSENKGSIGPWLSQQKELIEGKCIKAGKRFCSSLVAMKSEGKKRVRVRPIDVAITFYVLDRIRKKMNANGGLPEARVIGLWQWLKDMGVIDRPFDGSRFKMIRDNMTRYGWIDWQDHTYWFDEDKPGSGRCCKWCPNHRFVEMLEECEISTTSKEEGEGGLVGNTYPLISPECVSPDFLVLNDPDYVTQWCTGPPLIAA